MRVLATICLALLVVIGHSAPVRCFDGRLQGPVLGAGVGAALYTSSYFDVEGFPIAGSVRMGWGLGAHWELTGVAATSTVWNFTKRWENWFLGAQARYYVPAGTARLFVQAAFGHAWNAEPRDSDRGTGGYFGAGVQFFKHFDVGVQYRTYQYENDQYFRGLSLELGVTAY